MDLVVARDDVAAAVDQERAVRRDRRRGERSDARGFARDGAQAFDLSACRLARDQSFARQGGEPLGTSSKRSIQNTPSANILPGNLSRRERTLGGLPRVSRRPDCRPEPTHHHVALAVEVKSSQQRQERSERKDYCYHRRRWVTPNDARESVAIFFQNFANSSALEKTCKPEDVADAILWLVEGAGLVTGQLITVDGGFLLGRAVRVSR